VARSPRRIVSPPQWQAKARDAAVNALRAMDDYDKGLVSLRLLWSATQIPPMSAKFLSVRILEHIQHEPHGADQYEKWDVRPSDSLRTYLRKLNEVVAGDLHLTAAGDAAWWVKQVLHEDAIEHKPPPNHSRIDLGTLPAPKPAPEVRIHVAGFGVRVTLHDPATGELVTTQVFSALDAALMFVETTVTQHCQDQGWWKNPKNETEMLKTDIPALMAWYVAGDRPDEGADRRRLRALARHVLALDAPPSDAVAFPESRGTTAKGRRKTRGSFFDRLSENSV
jgi:hypothetical protein